MKKIYLLLLVPILNFSCSNEDALQNQDINPKNEHLRSSVLSKKNVSFEIIFADKRVEYDVLTDKYHSYDNSGLNYEFYYEGSLGAEVTGIDIFKITNSQNSDESFTLKKDSSSGKNLLQFTDENGIDHSGIEIIINPDYASQVTCWWCVPVVGIIVRGIVEATKETDCQTAVKACADSGGLPSTKISEGLFSASTCEVTCAPKPKN